MEEGRRFRALIVRGSEERLELSASIYAVFRHIERMRGLARDSRPLLLEIEVFEDFIVALARAFGLEVYLGSSSTDAYGVTVDVEAGAHRVSRGLKWAREVPFRRIWVKLTDEEAVDLGVRVDRHRARGRGVVPEDLAGLLGPLHDRVDEALVEAAEDAADLAELWLILAMALEGQSVERINILAASYPLPRIDEKA